MNRLRALVPLMWKAIDHLGRAILVWAFGGALVVTTLVGWGASALDVMPRVFLVLLLGGVFLLSVAALSLLLPHVLNRIPPPPQPRSSPVPAAATVSAQGEADSSVDPRAVIHDAISVLEDQLRAIQRTTHVLSPSWQGEWRHAKAEVARHPAYDKAYRATERAFGAIAEDRGPEAIPPIQQALAELHIALDV